MHSSYRWSIVFVCIYNIHRSNPHISTRYWTRWYFPFDQFPSCRYIGYNRLIGRTRNDHSQISFLSSPVPLPCLLQATRNGILTRQIISNPHPCSPFLLRSAVILLTGTTGEYVWEVPWQVIRCFR
ncbi:hypothetical protein BD410DRAFT_585855 [Rickenella mellea]|uniref:Uncharacterized protein n=1 Tax=Rickenella mellea TaxID=50990 RepID=A0A4Y7PR06_9AGAM|nr:hypothetical protein BD410DRAFT_585855 [Rickenella mellea]